MKENLAETNDLTCQWCNKTFIRPSSFQTHMCEKKKRWTSQNMPGNRIGFNSWVKFYNTVHIGSNRSLSYIDFIKSPYYRGFVRFGEYCSSSRVISIVSYIDYLLKNSVPLDKWASDTVYTKFLIQFVKHEDLYDAIYRTAEALIDLSKIENIRLEDVFLYGPRGKICHMITQGQISPWVLYASPRAQEWLAKLSESEVSFINEYIDPVYWNIKIRRDPDMYRSAVMLLERCGI